MQDLKSKPILKLDWCSHKAAKYACENWHYSKTTPVGKLVKIGVWEDGKFIGVVLYGRGANKSLMSQFNMRVDQGCELVRVALRKHKTQVSRILSISRKMLKKISPNLELVVSYSDTNQGHHGGIYQADNWCYLGLNKGSSYELQDKDGSWKHPRSINAKYGSEKGFKKRKLKPKHLYVKPLNNKLEFNSKKYPKRVEHESNASSYQLEESGAIPTSSLHSSKGKV